MAPIAVVAALRETSTLFGAAISGRCCRKKLTPIRIASVLIIAAGAMRPAAGLSGTLPNPGGEARRGHAIWMGTAGLDDDAKRDAMQELAAQCDSSIAPSIATASRPPKLTPIDADSH